MTRLTKSLLLAGTVGIGLLAMGARGARADIVVELLPPPVPSVGGFTWTYDAILHPDQRIVSGNFFTIYDFAGFTGVHSQPSGWSFSSANVTAPPTGVTPVDNASLPNLTWTWTGAPIVPADNLTGIDLGDFSAESKFNQLTSANFVSEGTKNGGTEDGTMVANIGDASVPFVPEPCTLALLGMGAAPLLGGLRRRGRKA